MTSQVIGILERKASERGMYLRAALNARTELEEKDEQIAGLKREVFRRHKQLVQARKRRYVAYLDRRKAEKAICWLLTAAGVTIATLLSTGSWQ